MNRQRTKFYAIRRERIGPTRSNSRQIAVFMHRIITDPPPGMVIDHINGDTPGNRRSNLRIVTNRENTLNGRRVRRGGVHFAKDRGKWRAQIGHHGKTVHLGYYGSEEEARETVSRFRKSAGD